MKKKMLMTLLCTMTVISLSGCSLWKNTAKSTSDSGSGSRKLLEMIENAANAADSQNEDDDSTSDESSGETATHEHVLAQETLEEATCSNSGTIRYYCELDDCDYSYEETTSKTDHSPGEWEYLYALDNGYYEGQKCTSCGKILDYQYIAYEENTDEEVKTAGEDTATDANTASGSDNSSSGNTTSGSSSSSGGSTTSTSSSSSSSGSTTSGSGSSSGGNATSSSSSSSSGSTASGSGSSSDTGVETSPSQDENPGPAESTHTHSYDEGEITKKVTCTEDGVRTFTCSDCGDTYTEVIPSTGHTEREWETVRAATYTETGRKELRCSTCGLLLDTETISVLPHEHSYKETAHEDAGCESGGYTSYVCEICGDTYTETIDATGHHYSWSTEKAATCTEDGLKVYLCSTCGNVSDTETIPATGHTESGWKTDRTATCTADGSRHTECTVCGEALATESIAATGHSYGELIVTKESTEEEYGSGYYKCSSCGDKKTVVIEKAEPHTHDYELTDETAATCKAEGSKTYTCGTCGTSYTETSARLSHIPGDWEVETKATEDEEGLKVQKCTVCGETVNTEVIEKLAHTHNYEVTDQKKATCTEDGYTVYTCRKCGDSYTVTAAASGHSYKETGVTAATCEKDGKIVYTCENCGDEYSTAIGNLGHNYVETSRVEATCEKDGSITYTCDHDGCEDSYTETIKATGHTEGEWVETKAAELGVEGEESLCCAYCGEVLDTRTTDMLLTDGTDSVYYICTGYENGEPVMEMVIGHFDTEAAELIAEQVNELRAENGIAELTIVTGDASLQNLANVRALEMTYSYTHVRPTESLSISNTWSVGENIAMMTGFNGFTYTSTFLGNNFYKIWYQSSAHLENMKRTTYKSMAVSVFAEKLGKKYYNYYAVQNFSLTKNYIKYTGDAWD